MRSEKRYIKNLIFTRFGVDFGRLFGSNFAKNRDKFSIEFLVPNFLRQYARTMKPRRHSHRPNSKAVTQIWWVGLCIVPWSPGGPKEVRANCLRFANPAEADWRLELGANEYWKAMIAEQVDTGSPCKRQGTRGEN